MIGILGLISSQSYTAPVHEAATNFCKSEFHSRWDFKKQKCVWENGWAVNQPEIVVTDEGMPSTSYVSKKFFGYVEDNNIPRDALRHGICAITIQGEDFYVQPCRPWVTLKYYLSVTAKPQDKIKGESLEVMLEGETFYIPSRYVGKPVPMFHDHHSWGGGDRTNVETVSSGISWVWDGTSPYAHVIKSEVLETSGKVTVVGEKTFMGI